MKETTVDCRNHNTYIFIRGLTPPLRKTNWFGGIFAVTGKRGTTN